MPRRVRLSISGVPLHLVQRGINRSTCLYPEEDHLFYLEHLAEQAGTQACQIHAWCLLTYHVHLLLTPNRVQGLWLMGVPGLFLRNADPDSMTNQNGRPQGAPVFFGFDSCCTFGA